MIDWACTRLRLSAGIRCTHPECNPSEADRRERIAAEHRAEERKQMVRCEHCGTEGIYTYGGVIGPWSKDDGKQLTELTDILGWDGTRNFGSAHDLSRCFAKVCAQRSDVMRQLEETRTKLEQCERALKSSVEQHVELIQRHGKYMVDQLIRSRDTK